MINVTNKYNLKIGLWKIYDARTDELYHISNYDNNGKKHGIELGLNNNEIVKITYYINGVKEGFFYEKNNYYKSIEIKKGFYKKDSLHGKYIATKNGKIIHDYSNKNGYKHGLYIDYNNNGTVREKISYHNGLKNGIYHIYTHYGYPIKLLNYKYINKKSFLNGFQIKYHKKNCVKEISFYLNGQKHGIYILFDTKGKTIQKEYYNKGILTTNSFIRNKNNYNL